jgi:hypothetical protein
MATVMADDIHFEAEALVKSPSAIVWDILTDYRNGHPKILPPAFIDFTVESGGKGGGMVIRYTVRVAGTTRHVRHIVSEPEPGHILVEDAPDDPTGATFSLTPASDGDDTRLLITTDQTTAPGLPHLITRLLLPLIAPAIQRI